MNHIARQFLFAWATLAGIVGVLAAAPAAKQKSSRTGTHAILSDTATLSGSAEAPAGRLTLWYRQPAKDWEEGLPVGNGRLGAMVCGGVGRDILPLNEDTLWEGYRRNADNPAALKALP